MAKIVFIIPEARGHLNPSLSLAQELKARGHDILFLGKLDGLEIAQSQGINYQVYSEEEYPLGYSKKATDEIGKLAGKKALDVTISYFSRAIEDMFAKLPSLIKAAAPDLLIVDESLSAPKSIAEHMNIPFIILANALFLRDDSMVPPPTFNWHYHPGLLHQMRNKMGWMLFYKAVDPIIKQLDKWRLQRGMGKARLSRAEKLVISQAIQEFELPRKLIKNLHHVGPLAQMGRIENDDDFPWQEIEGQDFVYASMGTIQNGVEQIFHIIAQACADLNIKLVIALGGGADYTACNFVGNLVVVHYAPQLKLLEKATAVITHAGMNTAMEALLHGKPMVALPIANDQPGVAARVHHHE